MNYADEIKKNLTGDTARDIAWLKEQAKTYEGKPDGYLGIRECWRQIAILTMQENLNYSLSLLLYNVEAPQALSPKKQRVSVGF